MNKIIVWNQMELWMKKTSLAELSKTVRPQARHLYSIEIHITDKGTYVPHYIMKDSIHNSGFIIFPESEVEKKHRTLLYQYDSNMNKIPGTGTDQVWTNIYK